MRSRLITKMSGIDSAICDFSLMPGRKMIERQEADAWQLRCSRL